MFDKFMFWLFLFFLFDVIGWVIESTIESLYRKRFINRGFLKGPYTPIYGAGGVILAAVGELFKFNGFLVYVVGLIIATSLEYVGGAILERLFKKQFWDYSMMNFTYKNRISLVSSLFWGVLALFMTYVLYMPASHLANMIPEKVLVAINAVMTVAMGTDAIIQIDRHVNIKRVLSKLPAKQVREFFLRKKMELDRPFLLFREEIKRRLKLNGNADYDDNNGDEYDGDGGEATESPMKTQSEGEQ